MAGHAFVKLLVGYMLDQLGKHGATGVYTALLPLSLLLPKRSHFLFPLRSMIP
jgi:hypothetical protein